MNEAIIDVPPEEMKGSGFPVVGNTPMTQAMFRNAWNTSITVAPPAIMAPMSSAARSAMASPAYSTQKNSPMTKSAPTSPSSSPMTAKMKSLSEANRYWNFSWELPSPTPKIPPSASA